MLLRAGFPGRTTRRVVASAPPPSSPPTVHGFSTLAAGNASVNADFTGLGHSSGDLLLIARMTANAPAVGNVPPSGGWAEVSNSPQGQGTIDTVGAVALNIFWKISDGTETTVNLGDSGDVTAARAVVIKGNNSSPINATAGSVTASGGGTSRSLPGVTTTVDNCIILHFAATDRDNTGATWSGQTNGNLTSGTEAFDSGTATGTGGGIMLWHGVKATAGATGDTSATSGIDDNSAHITVAVRP